MSRTPHPRPSLARLVGWAVAVVLVAGAATGCGADEEVAGGPADPASTPPTEPATTAAAVPHEGDLDVVAHDFAFDDLPDLVAAGPHTVTFTNEGTETHEMFLFRNPDGLSLEEIAELGPEGAVAAVELQGIVVVAPGGTDSFDVDLAPGEYEVACFIPTPTDDRPHFAHGMHARITVE